MTNDKSITKSTDPGKDKKKISILSGGGMAMLSRLAKALMVPIAILPFAALINRVGVLLQTGFIPGSVDAQSATWWIGRILQIPGAIVFDNLALFFAIGIGFGMSDDFRGEAALAGAVAFLGLVAMTGPLGLAELFYNGTMQYDSGSIQELYAGIVSAVGGPENIANLNNGDVFTIVDGDGGELFTQTFLSVEEYFADKSQLLYFVTSWDMYLTDGGLYVIVPTIGYMLDVGVVGGIVSGGIVAYLYNNYRTIKIPQALSFFGGRRFIPMLAIASVWATGLGFALVWPWAQYELLELGKVVASPDAEAGRIFGFGVYAFFNRLVQPLGLHHIINTFLWFQFPISGPTLQAIADADGVVAGVQDTLVFGDINAYAAGVLGSGVFQSGFFPLYLGGYAGVATGLTLATPKENRKEVGIFFASTAFVAFLTGIDEPILFSFIFVSPILFAINTMLVPIFGMIITASHISVGFGFSAGLIDYLISFPSSWQMSQFQFIDGAWGDANTLYSIFANPLMILVWSGVMYVVYVPIFYYVTKFTDVQIEGREKDAEGNLIIIQKASQSRNAESYKEMALAVLKEVKADNIVEITNCTTRLRLTVIDNKTGINDRKLKDAGFNGVIRVGTNALQLIVGTDVEYVAEALIAIMPPKKTVSKTKTKRK